MEQSDQCDWWDNDGASCGSNEQEMGIADFELLLELDDFFYELCVKFCGVFDSLNGNGGSHKC